MASFVNLLSGAFYDQDTELIGNSARMMRNFDDEKSELRTCWSNRGRLVSSSEFIVSQAFVPL